MVWSLVHNDSFLFYQSCVKTQDARADVDRPAEVCSEFDWAQASEADSIYFIFNGMGAIIYVHTCISSLKFSWILENDVQRKIELFF